MHRAYTLALLAACLGGLASGCGPLLGPVDGPGVWSVPSDGGAPGGGGAGPDREPPTIANAAVSPGVLRFTGGQVSISANVADAGGVARVWAEITPPSGVTVSVEMARSAGQAYGAVWATPANTSESGAATICTVRIRARDVAGNSAGSDPIAVTVQAPASPPAGPPVF